MSHQHENGSTTLPRGFRFHHSEGDHQPTTPKSSNPAGSEGPPSPPRPNRLKVRRRNVSNFQAPTEQFLASVAAADIPIPTIEEPQIAPHVSSDCDMPDRDPLSINTSFLTPHTYNSRFPSLPTTPEPSMSMDENNFKRPDWSMETLPPKEPEVERPTSSSSHSSEDSSYSEGRLSRFSEDGSCTSPDSDSDSDCADAFSFTPYSKAKGKELNSETNEPHDPVLNANLSRKTRKNAPWTSAMNAHLWSIYLLYLQDPIVTPFRIGARAVPPEGVCHRVARQAKRSWKGLKGINSSKTPNYTSRVVSCEQSALATPIEDRPRTYPQWPHTSSATRAHLRELCRNGDTSSVQLHRHFQSRDPTPFTQRFGRRYIIPESQTSAPMTFSTKDIALSLTTSTSETMQPNGPLAQLATPNDSVPRKSTHQPRGWTRSRTTNLSLDDSRTRTLGSPFMSRTYGPSSTMDGAFDAAHTLVSRGYSDAISVPGPVPRLRSPLHFDRPQSSNNKEYQRRLQTHFENLNSGGANLKPNSMNEQIYGISLSGNQQRQVRTRAFTVGGDLLRNRIPGLFQPLPTEPEKTGHVSETLPSPVSQPKLLPSAEFEVPRLRSPFMEKPSNTFPRRQFQDQKAPVRHSGVATMHQPHRSVDSFDFEKRHPLLSRISRINTRLAEIRERENGNRN
ncbi:hypothetical protein EYC80_004928 [Monilinia laxa]|uniref:Uncharacterized protein n=1 Tax=Monilinia laxa TaxID=61186 RepID=A0A5N6KIK4_MONLA|nr:hypothetical protein EYC80_004928 [Monilinia laxa]